MLYSVFSPTLDGESMVPRIVQCVLVYLTCLLVAALLFGCNHRDSAQDQTNNGGPATTQAADDKDKNEIKLTKDAVERYGVTVAPARKQMLVETFTAPARLTFDQTALAQVTSVVPGRVVELKAELGDHVNRGDELAVVESTELGTAQSDYLEKRIAAAGAPAAVEPLKQAFERAQTLYQSSQGVSLAEMQKRKADYLAAEAAQRTAQAAVAAAESKLRLLGMDDQAIEQLASTGKLQPRHPVLAPMDGQIVDRNATRGQIVSPDKDTLFTVADLSKLWAIADVPESRLKDIVVGGAGRVVAAGQPVTGKIVLISPAVDPATQTAQVRIAIQDPPPMVRPGIFATAHLAEASAKAGQPVLAVPEGAVQTIDARTCVFVADDEPNTFVRRDVVVGPTVDQWVPVLSGLKEGDPVVTAGTFILKAELAKPGEGD